MDLRPLTILLAARIERMKNAKNAGQSAAELAVAAGLLIAIAIGGVAAIKTFTDAKIPLIGDGK